MALVFAHGLGAAVRHEVECKNAKQQCESGSSRHTPPVYWLEDLAKDAGWATSSAAGAGLSRQHPKRERCGTAPALVKVRKGERILWNFNLGHKKNTTWNFYSSGAGAAAMCDAWDEKSMLMDPPL